MVLPHSGVGLVAVRMGEIWKQSCAWENNVQSAIAEAGAFGQDQVLAGCDTDFI